MQYEKRISFWEAFNLYTYFASNLKGKTNKKNPQHSRLVIVPEKKRQSHLSKFSMWEEAHLVEPKNIASTLN